MITKEQILLFKGSADALYVRKDYTSATILYFKTLFAVQDFLLIHTQKLLTKTHVKE